MVKNYSKLYQHGTLATLVPGLFEGTFPIGKLLKNGDTGIGTATGLGGEMVVLEGTPYLVKSDGKIATLPDETMVPFATVHFDDKNAEKIKVNDLNEADLGEKIFHKNALENVFFAVKITGNFSHVKTRAVAAQKRPYPTLAEVADKQAIFEGDNSQGTVIGYFSPELFQGMASAGFHLHYLNDNKTMGGHLLDFTVSEGSLAIQPFASVEQHFPLEDQEFMQHNFELSKMDSEIRHSES